MMRAQHKLRELLSTVTHNLCSIPVQHPPVVCEQLPLSRVPQGRAHGAPGAMAPADSQTGTLCL
jgi:hypothetical protein